MIRRASLTNRVSATPSLFSSHANGPKSRSRTDRDHQVARRFETAALFAGIGGIELGFARAGHETSLFCEIDTAARAVLQARFPDDVRFHDDVCSLKALPRGVEILTAGFPCQDLSQAGKTAGIAGRRSGLVAELFRVLRQSRVPRVLVENVPFMLQLDGGRALDVILGEFERLGYDWAYRIVDSRGFGVPQRRERVFILACQDEDPRAVLLADDVGPRDAGAWRPGQAFGFYWTEGIRGLGSAVDAVPTLKGGSTIGIPSPPAILLRSGSVVTPDIRDAERMQGFPANWTRPAESVARASFRWKLVGNAVTVHVAQWIGRRLSRPGTYDDSLDRTLEHGAPWPRAAWARSSKRFASNVSSYPVHRTPSRIEDFLRYPTKNLSARATSGFLGRARVSSLRFPEGFLPALEKHLLRVKQTEVPAASRRSKS